MERGGAATAPTTATTATVAAAAASGAGQEAPSGGFPGAPTRTGAPRSARSAPEPCRAAVRNRRAAADLPLCAVPGPSGAFRARSSLVLRRPLATMPRATALGVPVPLLLPVLLLLLPPLPRGAGGLAELSDAAPDYSALEGEEGAEQQLEHYHDPCKAGRCRRRRGSPQKFAFEMQMSGGQACAAVCGAGLPPLPPRSPGSPGKQCHSGWDVPAAGLRRAPGGSLGSVPTAEEGGRPGRLTARCSARAAARRAGLGAQLPGSEGALAPVSPRLQVVRKVSRDLVPALGKRRTKPEKLHGGHRESGS